jgi:hypothetical protein
MRWYRFLPLLATVAALVLLTGALKGPAGSSPPEPASAHPRLADDLDGASTDDNAQATLDEAIAALAPARVQWLETAIWQKVRLPGLEYEAHGRYLLAPDRRFRLELTTQPGTKTEGTVLVVSDGATLWQARRAGGPDWQSATRQPLEDVAEDGSAGDAPLPRDESLGGPTFPGARPLLRNLRSRLRWVRREVLPNDQVRLSGVWRVEALAGQVPASGPWPVGLPRRCRLLLDARTSWPQRVEWWGPVTEGGANVLLVELELRSPQVNLPFSAERAAAMFSFRAGSVPITDRTKKP